MTDLAVHRRRLEEIERDVDALAEGQRNALREVAAMVKEGLAAVDVTCSRNVESVRKDMKAAVAAVAKDVHALTVQGQRAVWSRADKLSVSGLAALIVLGILGFVLK